MLNNSIHETKRSVRVILVVLLLRTGIWTYFNILYTFVTLFLFLSYIVIDRGFLLEIWFFYELQTNLVTKDSLNILSLLFWMFKDILICCARVPACACMCQRLNLYCVRAPVCVSLKLVFHLWYSEVHLVSFFLSMLNNNIICEDKRTWMHIACLYLFNLRWPGKLAYGIRYIIHIHSDITSTVCLFPWTFGNDHVFGLWIWRKFRKHPTRTSVTQAIINDNNRLDEAPRQQGGRNFLPWSVKKRL